MKPLNHAEISRYVIIFTLPIVMKNGIHMCQGFSNLSYSSKIIVSDIFNDL